MCGVVTTLKQPVRIATIELNELNSAFIEGDIVDELGAPVTLAMVTEFTIDLYDDNTGTHINGREELDILNVNGGTFHATSGHFTFTFESADNPILGLWPRGRREAHTARLTLIWGATSPPTGRWDGEVKLLVANLGHVSTP